MNLVSDLVVYVIVIGIISFGIGMVLGGPDMGKKVLAWELKKLSKLGRWTLKQVFQTIANIFQYFAHQCGGNKKKTP